jgi:hypothetical protein
MGVKRKKGLAVTLSFVMAVSTLLMSFPNRAYANHDSAWDPLNEWLPGDNMGTDPVEALMQRLQGGRSRGAGGNGAPDSVPANQRSEGRLAG